MVIWVIKTFFYSSSVNYCHLFLLCYAKSLQSCPTLCDPIDSSPPGSPVPEILQARTLEWVAISFSSAWKWKVRVKLLSRVWPSATPWTAAYQGPLSMRFFQARVQGCHCLLQLPLLNVFLMSSASVRFLLILSFIVPFLAWSVHLVYPVFLKKYLVFSILWFSSLSLYCSFKKAFLSLLAILWNSAFSWVYLSLSPLSFTSLLSLGICLW